MTQYLYGNLSNPFQVTASRAPDNTHTVYYYDDFSALYALERGGVRYYVGSDHLGTPKVVTDNTGAIVRQAEYDSWGVKISDTNPGFDLPVGFAGGIPDGAAGLVRFGFRDYEPGTGRWTAKDPVFFNGGLNMFQYSGNNPINIKDPSGQKAFWYHFADGFRAGRAMGRGIWDSLKLGWKVMGVDFGPHKNDATYHADASHRGQDPNDALKAASDLAGSNWSKGDEADAIHTWGDVGMGDGSYYPGFFNDPIGSAGHWIRDMINPGSFGDDVLPHITPPPSPCP